MTGSLDRVFFALSDPTRRAILAQLSEGAATVGDLAAPYPMSLPGISKHLQVLADADLIVRRRRGRFFECRLNASSMQAAAEWIDRYRVFWNRQLDSLEEYFAAEQDPSE